MTVQGAEVAGATGIVNYEGLRGFIEKAEEIGELARIDGASWQEDIGMATEVLQHARKCPAALFDNIPGYPSGYRVLVNSMNSMRRVAMMLGLPIDAPVPDLIQMWREKLAHLTPLAAEYVSTGPVMENVLHGDDVDLLKFPTPKWHEADGGRYIGTGSMDVTRDPDDGTVNVGTYRVMIHERNKAGFYISPGKHGRMHREKFFARNEACPVCVVIGVDPLVWIASATEVPLGVNEYDWAGAVKGQPYKLVRGIHTGLPFPADAEIVIEGFASPQERLVEGPFGEWTGYYASASRAEPVIDVKAIYHRNSPILFGCPPAKPPDEQARFRAFMRSALVKEDLEKSGVPDVTSVWCHEAGGSRLFIAVAIKQRYPGHARQAGHIAAMCHSGAYLGRYVVVVDDDIDVTDIDEVIWAMCTRADPADSIDIIHRAWSGPLDPAIHPDKKGFNSRAIIDACRPYEWRDKFPAVNMPTPELRRRAMEKFGYLIGQ